MDCEVKQKNCEVKQLKKEKTPEENIPNDYKKVSIDFDGVLNEYSGYVEDELGVPRVGAKDFLQKLYEEGYKIIIHTCRDADDVRDWLEVHDLSEYVPIISIEKIPSIAYIDDRAIAFDGNYQSAYMLLKNFETHWEPKDDIQKRKISVEVKFTELMREIESIGLVSERTKNRLLDWMSLVISVREDVTVRKGEENDHS